MTVLRQRMMEDMQVRNLSPHTQASYLQQVSLFARHFAKSPDVLAPEHIRTYQIYLTNERKLAAGSIHIAVAALRFLYKITLKREWTFADVLPLPKKPQKLPVVLSPEEVVHFLGCVACRKQRVILTACYAAGLRVSEAVRLNAGAIDSKRMVIRVEQGKGRKDRYVMLSPKLLEILRAYWKAAHPKEWLFSGCSSRSADHERSRRRRLPKGTSSLRPIQTCDTAFVTPRLCGTFTRVWHRRPDHSAAAWSSQPGYHRQVLTNSYEQGLRHVQPPGPAAASGSRGAKADTAKTLLSWGRWPAQGRKSRTCSAATAKPIVSVMAPRYAPHSVAS